MKAKSIALANLEDTLDKMKTHPDITSLIVLVIKNEEPPKEEVADKSDINLCEVMEVQSDIGWDLLKFGILHLHGRSLSMSGLNTGIKNMNINTVINGQKDYKARFATMSLRCGNTATKWSMAKTGKMQRT